jgi:Na+/H+ antiporter NhaB
VNYSKIFFWWAMGTLALFVAGKLLPLPLRSKTLFNLAFVLTTALIIVWLQMSDPDTLCHGRDTQFRSPYCE